MVYSFILPDSGEGITESEIVSWAVQPGDKVKEDDVLAEIQSDKTVVALPSPVAGVIKTLHFDEGDVPKVGDVMLEIEVDDPKDANSEGTPAKEDSEEKVVRERGTDTVVIEGEDLEHLEPATELQQQASEPASPSAKDLGDEVDIRMLAIPAVRQYAR